MKLGWVNGREERGVKEVVWGKDVGMVEGGGGRGKSRRVVEGMKERVMGEREVVVMGDVEGIINVERWNVVEDFCVVLEILIWVGGLVIKVVDGCERSVVIVEIEG